MLAQERAHPKSHIANIASLFVQSMSALNNYPHGVGRGTCGGCRLRPHPPHILVLLSLLTFFQWSHPLFPATILVVDLTRPIVRAPEFPQAPWVNALEPLTMTGLRGRVVMVDIWDFT